MADTIDFSNIEEIVMSQSTFTALINLHSDSPAPSLQKGDTLHGIPCNIMMSTQTHNRLLELKANASPRMNTKPISKYPTPKQSKRAIYR